MVLRRSAPILLAALLLTPAAGRASIQFESATYTVTESANLLSVRLTRNDDPNAPQSFTLSIRDVTATRNLDYIFSPIFDQPWPSGDVSIDLTVTILSDALDEVDETFELSVSAGDRTGIPAVATITIQDDDGAATTPTPVRTPSPTTTPPAGCNSACLIAVVFCEPTPPRIDTPTPVGGEPTVTPAPIRPASWSVLARAAALATFDPDVYLRLRKESFLETPVGRHFADLYNTHTREMSDLARANPQALAAAGRVLATWQPAFLALLEGRGSTEIISASQVADFQKAFDVFESLGSPQLRLALERQEALLGLTGYVGLTAEAARLRLESVAPPAAVLPVATSVHGAGGSFFHSDVRVLNPSDFAPVTVAARYRCGASSCGASEQAFTLAPGELRAFDDIVVSLFGAPETFGAIEFTGDVLVDSRIYTPSRPSPTTGMYAPGQAMDEAYPEAVLLALSHSTDSSRGFRTNVGAYNGNDVALTVTFALFDASGAALGIVTRSVPARVTVQVNNVFDAAGVTHDVESAYAVVRGDGVHELFAYAAVVDNQTQDPFLIRGRNNRAFENGAILPAVASVHGVGGAFFHSDVHVLNPDPAEPVTVRARYRCAGGSCGAAEQTFVLAPRQMRTFDDIVGGLFGAPETFGAVEFEGSVLVDSRLYTPSRPGPTAGMAIPGVRRERADPESYLPFLSHSADLARGFRTNLGVYNVNDASISATISLYGAAGDHLADVVRSVPARGLVQVNDVFGAAGIGHDVEDAYAVVRADGVHEFLAYAAVVDNRTQDPTFAFGRGRVRIPTGPPPSAAAPTRGSLPKLPTPGFLVAASLLLALGFGSLRRRQAHRPALESPALREVGKEDVALPS